MTLNLEIHRPEAVSQVIEKINQAIATLTAVAGPSYTMDTITALVAQQPPLTPEGEIVSEEEMNEEHLATPTPPPRVEKKALVREQKEKKTDGIVQHATVSEQRRSEIVQRVEENIARRHEIVQDVLKQRKSYLSKIARRGK